MNSVQRVDVPIPMSKLSPSQQVRRNKTCWCREIHDVATPATTGHAFTGVFHSPGLIRNLPVGAVLIHFDETEFAKLGIVVINSKGTGIIRWIEHCAASAWVGSFAARCRSLVQMSTDDRVRVAANHVLTKAHELDPSALAYWQQIVGIEPGEFNVKHEAISLFDRVRPLVPPGPLADELDTFILKCRATL